MDKITIKDSRIYCTQGPEHLAATSIGILSGLKFVFKDLFDVQGYLTGAGNPQWLVSHAPAEQSSMLINNLLAHGADCIGRVQTDELAYSLNGQNIHYGTPVNPRAPECIPGGSSSGSAVTVANGQADFSIGTDTGGSVRIPASYCGLFGLRPTLGKLDLHNCFQLAKSFDTAGIFSADLNIMFDVFSVLSAQPKQGKVANNIYLDKTLAKYLSSERLQRLEKWSRDTSIKLIRCDLLAKKTYNLDHLSLLFRTIQGFEIIELHGSWLATHKRSLDPAILARVNWASGISKQQYLDAKAQQKQFQAAITTITEDMHGLWILPTTPSGPPALTLAEDKFADYRSQLMGLTSIAGLVGFPQLHLPMQGLHEGPCGFSLMGPADSEPDLFATAQCLWQGEL